MNLRAISAALKAKYRPVFRGGMEREGRRFEAMAKQTQADALALTGAGRAIASMTEGKGE